jgi:hypothetical protein
MKIPLQEWLQNNQPKDEMYWKGSAQDQFYFMRYAVIGAFPLKDKPDLENFRANLCVISTHTSKSITLPVYEILWNGFRFILRGNFHDWKVSIDSPIPIFINFSKFGLFNPEQKIHYVYCEGFQGEWVYGPYAGNPKQFTIELRNNEHEVYCFLKILTHTF